METKNFVPIDTLSEELLYSAASVVESEAVLPSVKAAIVDQGCAHSPHAQWRPTWFCPKRGRGPEYTSVDDTERGKGLKLVRST